LGMVNYIKALRNFCTELRMKTEIISPCATDRRFWTCFSWDFLVLIILTVRLESLSKIVAQNSPSETQFYTASMHSCQQELINTMRLFTNNLRKVHLCQIRHTFLLFSKKQDWTLLCQ